MFCWKSSIHFSLVAESDLGWSSLSREAQTSLFTATSSSSKTSKCLRPVSLLCPAFSPRDLLPVGNTSLGKLLGDILTTLNHLNLFLSMWRSSNCTLHLPWRTELLAPFSKGESNYTAAQNTFRPPILTLSFFQSLPGVCDRQWGQGTFQLTPSSTQQCRTLQKLHQSTS